MRNETAGEQLERLLFNCQQMALRTLRGPGSIWNEKVLPPGASRMQFSPNYAMRNTVDLRRKLPELPFDFHMKLPLPVPALPPIFFTADPESDTSEVSYCEIEGKKVACFNIGGEDRLCLPPILNDLLKGIDLNDTNQACEKLQVYFSRCTPFQLEQLKHQKILPAHIFSAGLIRKTDAERLCNLLLHQNITPIINPEERKYPQINDSCFPIYHECFGEGHGFFYTELYTQPKAKCISCADCERLFSPDRFITHSHYNQENGVCHWGFDRNRWRSYLLLSEDEIEDCMLSNVAEAFQRVLEKYQDCPRRRKVSSCNDDEEIITRGVSSSVTVPPSQPTPIPVKRRCLRPPMRASGYDEQGQPVLAEPDRAVMSTDTHLYEKHYIPNVSLKPSKTNENEEILDLSSPTQTVVNTKDSNDNEVDDEILDVTSTNGDDNLSVLSKDEKLTYNKDKEENADRCLIAMKELFVNVLEKSDLPESDKNGKLESFTELYNKLKDVI